MSSLEERGLACSVGRPIFESEMALRADLGLYPSGSGSRLPKGVRPGELQRNAGGLRRRTSG